jgi:hypothetical protein
MSKYDDIVPEDAEILRKLENFMGREIFPAKVINWNNRGFLIENNRLTGLGLYNCGLKILPEFLGGLNSLKNLYIARNNIADIPDFISELKSITKLYIAFNELSNFPESILDLKNLHYLSLS